VCGALLVANQNVPYVVSGHLVIEVQNGAARKPEYDLYTLFFQTLEKYLRTFEFHKKTLSWPALALKPI
jgi:hypothetical protein